MRDKFRFRLIYRVVINAIDKGRWLPAISNRTANKAWKFRRRQR